MPNKADNLLNKTKDNAKIERMKDALVDIKGKIRISGNLGSLSIKVYKVNWLLEGKT